MSKLRDFQRQTDLVWDVIGGGVMAPTKMTGTVMRVMGDKGFGFIKGTDGKEYFFHRSGFNGFFDDLVHDCDGGRTVQVEFEVVPSPKGPRASNVTRVDGGV